MAEAFPLGSKHYLQFLRVGREAPRREVSWTTETEGKGRFGRGQTLRLFGPYALVVGSWTSQDPSDLIPESDVVFEGLGHDLTEEQFAQLRLIFSDHNVERLRTGWIPPRWHYRRYLQAALPLLSRLRLVTVHAYGEIRLRKPWKRRKTTWTPMSVPTRDWDDVERRIEDAL